MNHLFNLLRWGQPPDGPGKGQGHCSHDGGPESSSLEELVWNILSENSSISLSTLIDRVAEEAMVAEQKRGAWVTDIGVWGPAYFRREAEQIVIQMLGVSLALQDEGPPLIVPVHPPVRHPRAR